MQGQEAFLSHNLNRICQRSIHRFIIFYWNNKNNIALYPLCVMLWKWMFHRYVKYQVMDYETKYPAWHILISETQDYDKWSLFTHSVVRLSSWRRRLDDFIEDEERDAFSRWLNALLDKEAWLICLGNHSWQLHNTTFIFCRHLPSLHLKSDHPHYFHSLCSPFICSKSFPSQPILPFLIMDQQFKVNGETNTEEAQIWKIFSNIPPWLLDFMNGNGLRILNSLRIVNHQKQRRALVYLQKRIREEMLPFHGIEWMAVLTLRDYYHVWNLLSLFDQGTWWKCKYQQDGLTRQ